MAVLADFLGIDRSSVSGLIDRAERRGLVARQTSAEDARVTTVELTAAGTELGGQIAATVNARVEQLLAGLPASERPGLVRLAESITKAEAP
jgi:DNA-binding MarR family transcriptional regulator